MIQRVRFVGFCFAPHPKSNHFLQYCLYQESENRFLLCVSEGPGNGDYELAQDGLGSTVAKMLIVPFIARTFDSDLNTTKTLVEKIGEWNWAA